MSLACEYVSEGKNQHLKKTQQYVTCMRVCLVSRKYQRIISLKKKYVTCIACGEYVSVA